MPQYLVRATIDRYIIIEAASEEDALDKAEHIEWKLWEESDVEFDAELHEPEESSF